MQKYSLADICDSIFLLINKCGILHGESLFCCELSDFGGFVKIDEDPHPLHCVVMTILQGGVNPNRTLYGRFFRSLNDGFCRIGSIFMYIFLR